MLSPDEASMCSWPSRPGRWTRPPW